FLSELRRHHSRSHHLTLALSLVVNTHHLIIGADPMGLSAARQLELKGCHALALYFVWWNFVKLHKARKLTPAPRRAGEARQLGSLVHDRTPITEGRSDHALWAPSF